jgi:hypothetical protein
MKHFKGELIQTYESKGTEHNVITFNKFSNANELKCRLILKLLDFLESDKLIIFEINKNTFKL